MHGNLYGEDLNTLFKDMNLAISCLALSKKNMKEACPLKSREYIIRGIPFIYAYKDTDLNGDEIFAERFSEDTIDISEIISFAKLVSTQVDSVQKAMSLKAQEVSWSNKLKQMSSFVKEIL